MRKRLEPSWMSTDAINSFAIKFLKTYCNPLSIPVPIDRIVEFDLEMDIIPIPGLKRDLTQAGFDIDGFISSDFKSITVDQYTMEAENMGARYRFTLSHEIGHKVLHEDLYQQYRFDTFDEWKSTILNMPIQEREMIEWQAREFAGLVLVPRAILKREFDTDQEETIRLFGKKHPAMVSDITVHSLAKKFDVSDEVIRIRLERDRLIKPR